MGFRRQLSLAFSLGILLLALVTTVVVSRVSTQAMRERIISESTILVQSLAEQSTLSLLYESADNAAEAVKIFTGFADVVGVEILQVDDVVLYRDGVQMQSDGTVSIGDKPTLSQEFNDKWEFTAPVIYGEMNEELESPETDVQSQQEIIGYVKLYVSKQSLNNMADNVFWFNLVLSVGLAAVLLIILMAISRRLINPIHHLASIMSAAQKGEKVKHVALSGPPDIQDMFKAFNRMLGVLENREQELKKARDAAYELAKVKGEFAANVSHELRTPMNGVLGMLDILTDLGLTGKQREYVSVAKNSAGSLLTLINDILDFSKNEAGKAVLEKEEFDLYSHLEEVMLLLGTQTQTKKINLAYLIQQDVPRFFKGDTDKLRQLFMNLISNAIKFTEKGSVNITVKVNKDVAKSEQFSNLLFEINDTGIGIPEDKQAHIFGAFSQVDGSTTRKFGGTGLGLSICKQVVHLMDGEIDVRSRIGEGSCFWFTLQLENAEGTDPAGDFTLSHLGLKAIVVDASEAVRSSVKAMLQKIGIAASIAENSQHGKNTIDTALAKGEKIDLLVLEEDSQNAASDSLVEYLAQKQNTQAYTIVLVNRSVGPMAESGELRRIAKMAKPVLLSHLQNITSMFWVNSDSLEDEAIVLAADDAEPVFKDKCLLVVDDNPVNLMVATGLLKPFECELDTATNGLECLQKLTERNFDLILMDCDMPEMDGYLATQKIREAEKDNGSHIKIIAITANAAVGDKGKCIAAGMDDYLAKPFDRDDLQLKLTRWL